MKILIIGLGGIGQRHTRNLRALLGDSVEIIAYRTRRLTHVVTPTMGADQERNVEEVYNIRSFDSLDAALAQKPDAAFICNPSSLHVAVTRACLQAGCDVFIEKPLADSLDGTTELAALAAANSRIAMVGYQLRFHPCVIRLQQVVAGGALGSLLGVRATIGEYLPNWHPYEDYRTMYAARADLGGGVVLTHNAANNPKVESDPDSRAEPQQWSRLENFPLAVWNADIAVGLTGAFLCSRIFGQEMVKRNAGVILNIASDLSVIAPDQRLYRKDGIPEDQQPVKPVTYSVVKTALVGLTRYLATYWATHHIRVNAISPGGVFAGQPDEFTTKLHQLIPMGRMAHKDEYQGAILFLCSDASSYMTGQNLIVDGGRSVL